MNKNKLKVSTMALSVFSVFVSLSAISTGVYAQNNPSTSTQLQNPVQTTQTTQTTTTTIQTTNLNNNTNTNINSVNTLSTSTLDHVRCSCVPVRKHKIYKLNNNHTARDVSKHKKYNTMVARTNQISLVSVPDVNTNDNQNVALDIPLTTHSEIIKDAGWFSSKRKIAFSMATDYQDGLDKTLTPDFFISNPSVLIVNQNLSVSYMEPAQYDAKTGKFFLDFRDYDNSDCYRAFIVANPRENGKTQILATDFFKDGTAERVSDEAYPQDNYINPGKSCKQVKASDLYGDTTTIVEENGYTLDISNDQINEQLPEAEQNVSLTVSLLKDGWYAENLPILPDSHYGMQLIFINDAMDDFSIIDPDSSSFNRKNPEIQNSPFKFKVQFKQPGIYHALVKFVDKKSGETMVMPIKVTVNDGTNLSDRYKYDDMTPPEPKANPK
jgi:hypothetical protein